MPSIGTNLSIKITLVQMQGHMAAVMSICKFLISIMFFFHISCERLDHFILWTAISIPNVFFLHFTSNNTKSKQWERYKLMIKSINFSNHHGARHVIQFYTKHIISVAKPYQNFYGKVQQISCKMWLWWKWYH